MTPTPFADLLRALLPLIKPLAAAADEVTARAEASLAEEVAAGNIAASGSEPLPRAASWLRALDRHIKCADNGNTTDEPESVFVDETVHGALDELRQIAIAGVHFALRDADFDREKRLRALAIALELTNHAARCRWHRGVDEWLPYLERAHEALRNAGAVDADVSIEHLFERVAETVCAHHDAVCEIVKPLTDEIASAFSAECRRQAQPNESCNFPVPVWGQVADIIDGELTFRAAFRRADAYMKATGARYYCYHCDGACTPEHLAMLADG